MKKQVVTLGIIVLLLSVGLSGCTSGKGYAYYNYDITIQNSEGEDNKYAYAKIRVINNGLDKGVDTSSIWWDLVVDGIAYDYDYGLTDYESIEILPGGDATFTIGYEIPFSGQNYSIRYSGFYERYVRYDSSIEVKYETYEEPKEEFTTLEDGTKVYGDIDKLEILNYSVVTEKENHWDYQKIGDGFVHSEDASRYRVNITVKNIAGELLDRIRIDINYYDSLDNHLYSNQEYEWHLYMEETIEFSFTWYNSSYPSYFEHADHISFEISVS